MHGNHQRLLIRTAAAPKIVALTGLRGVAAAVVIAYHYSSYQLGSKPGPAPFGPGYLAVDLFFLLSGFVMAMNYGELFRVGFRMSNFRTFLLRRFARVYPVYIVITLLIFLGAKMHIRGFGSNNSAIISNPLLVQNWGIGIFRPGLGQSIAIGAWSLSTEAAAYIIFPILAGLALFRRWRAALLTAALCCLALVGMAFAPRALTHAVRGALDINAGDTLWPLARCFAEFTLGMVVWRASREPWAAYRRTFWSDVALVAGLACAWSIPGADVLIVGLFAFAVLHWSTDESPIAKALGSWGGVWLGELSYSVYLIHMIALMVLAAPIERRLGLLNTPAPHILALIAVGILDFVVAFGLFGIVEKPSRRWLRELFEGRKPPPIETDPAAP